MISLSLTGHIVVPEDDTPLEAECFDPATYIDAFCKLPVHAGDNDTLTLAKVYRRMTPRTRDAMLALGNHDEEFGSLLKSCHESYAAFAHPDLNDWPEFNETEIIDFEYLTGLDIRKVFTVLDGRRFVELEPRDETPRFLTHEEFRLLYCNTVAGWIQGRLDVITKQAMKVLKLCEPGDPTTYDIRYANANMVAGRMIIKAYSTQSLRRYAKKMRFTITEITTREPATLT